MQKEIKINVPLTPDQCLERIGSATIPILRIVDLRSPIKSYTTYLKNALLGPEQYVSKIEAYEFSIMPIGIWLFKTHAITANVGSLKGSVVSTKWGSQIDARFKLFASFLIPWVFLCSAPILFSCALFLLLLFNGPNIDSASQIGTMIAACLLLLLPTIFVGYILFSVWHQGRSASMFLKELFADAAAFDSN